MSPSENLATPHTMRANTTTPPFVSRPPTAVVVVRVVGIIIMAALLLFVPVVVTLSFLLSHSQRAFSSGGCDASSQRGASSTCVELSGPSETSLFSLLHFSLPRPSLLSLFSFPMPVVLRFAEALCPPLPPAVVMGVILKDVASGSQFATAWSLSVSTLSFAFPPGYWYPSPCANLKTFTHNAIARYDHTNYVYANVSGGFGNCTARFEQKVSWVDLTDGLGCTYRYIDRHATPVERGVRVGGGGGAAAAVLGAEVVNADADGDGGASAFGLSAKKRNTYNYDKPIVSMNIICLPGGGIVSPLDRESLYNAQFDFTTLWFGSGAFCRNMAGVKDISPTVPLTYPLSPSSVMVVVDDAESPVNHSSSFVNSADTVIGSASSGGGPSPFVPPFDPLDNEGGLRYRRSYPPCGTLWGDGGSVMLPSPTRRRTTTATTKISRSRRTSASRRSSGSSSNTGGGVSRRRMKGMSSAESEPLPPSPPSPPTPSSSFSTLADGIARHDPSLLPLVDALPNYQRENLERLLLLGTAGAAKRAAASQVGGSGVEEEDPADESAAAGSGGSGSAAAQTRKGKGDGRGGQSSPSAAVEITGQILAEVVEGLTRQNAMAKVVEEEKRLVRSFHQSDDGSDGADDGITANANDTVVQTPTPVVSNYQAHLFLCTVACGLVAGDTLATMQQVVAFNQASMIQQYTSQQYSTDHTPLAIQPPISNLIFDAFTILEENASSSSSTNEKATNTNSSIFIGRLQTDVPLDGITTSLDCVGGQPSGFFGLTGAIRVWKGFTSYLAPFTSRNHSEAWDMPMLDLLPSCAARMRQLRGVIGVVAAEGPNGTISYSASPELQQSAIERFFFPAAVWDGGFSPNATAINGFYVDLDPGADCAVMITDVDRDAYTQFLLAFTAMAARYQGGGVLNVYVGVGAPVLSTPPPPPPPTTSSAASSNSSTSAYTVLPNLWTSVTNASDVEAAWAEVQRRVLTALRPVAVKKRTTASSSSSSREGSNASPADGSGGGDDSSSSSSANTTTTATTFFIPQVVALDPAVTMRYAAWQAMNGNAEPFDTQSTTANTRSGSHRRDEDSTTPAAVAAAAAPTSGAAPMPSPSASSTAVGASALAAYTFNATRRYGHLIANFTQRVAPTARQCAVSYNGTSVYYTSSNGGGGRTNGNASVVGGGGGGGMLVVPAECLERPRAILGVTCWGGTRLNSASYNSSSSSPLPNGGSATPLPPPTITPSPHSSSSITALPDGVPYFSLLRQMKACQLFIDARDSVTLVGNLAGGYAVSRRFLMLLDQHRAYCSLVGP